MKEKGLDAVREAFLGQSGGNRAKCLLTFLGLQVYILNVWYSEKSKTENEMGLIELLKRNGGSADLGREWMDET